MIAHLLAVLVVAASPVKPSGAAKKLVGAWYQGDTQYLDLKADGTGRLGVLEMQWAVEAPGNIRLIFKEDGAEKNLEYSLGKSKLLRLKLDASHDLELKRGKPKEVPKAVTEDKDKDKEKDKKAAPKKPKAAPKKS